MGDTKRPTSKTWYNGKIQDLMKQVGYKKDMC